MSKRIILDWFFQLTPEQIIDGINAIYDNSTFEYLLETNSPGLVIVLDMKMQEIAFLWLESHKDEFLTRMSYS